MLYLKKINYDDIEEEYKAFRAIPFNENGFENKYHDVTMEELKEKVIPKLLKNSEGLELEEGYVPDTYFFLWNDNKIVGLFKIRHFLNDYLKKGPGHIGYGILPSMRGKGYATKGLELAIDKCKELISEDEIYLSFNKDNPASLKVQLNCGAFIVGETDSQYLTRIRFNNPIKFGFKDLKRDTWKRILKKGTKVESIKNKFFEGKVCYLNIIEVSSPLVVDSPIGKVKIVDNHFKQLIFAPKNQNWWLTVMFDDQNRLIESYFDITKINDFSDSENPYFVDMKLDVCIPNGYGPSLMDEDELKEVYERGLITKEDYTKAYETANKIIETYTMHKEEYYKYIYEFLNKYKK